MSQAILEVDPAMAVSLSSTYVVPVLPRAIANVADLGVSAAGLSTLADLATWINANTGSQTFTGRITSVTGIATPSALVATTFTAFASTVSGAVLMGYGTTHDVALKNRAGTTALGVLSNTVTVAMAGGFTSVLGATIQTLTVGLGLGAVASNTAIGVSSLGANTSGASNTAVGYATLGSNQSGANNTGIGYGALNSTVSGGSNTAVGFNALTLTTGGNNTSIGRSSSPALTSGGGNVAVGYLSLLSNQTGSNNVCIGQWAGGYETGSNAFYVNNQDRTDTAGDIAKSLMYGTFNATALSQTLLVNGQFSCIGKVVSASPTAGLGYATGAGGTVAQGNGSGKATAFTLSTVSGQITTDNAALNAGVIVSAVWTNTAIAATDAVIVNHVSGGTVGSYTFNVQCGAGTATLNIRNATAGNLTEALVLQFVVVKGVNA